MVRDTAQTREKLLSAGVRQFAASGFSGARIDSIAADAGVNKERIYRYFGDKKAFFEAVLAQELSGMLNGITLGVDGIEDVVAFATELFDKFQSTPQLARLLAWESLELPEAIAQEQRRAACAETVQCLQNAIGCTQEQAEQFLLSIIALVLASPNLARISEAIIGDHASIPARRAAFTEQVRAIANALQMARSGK